MTLWPLVIILALLIVAAMSLLACGLVAIKDGRVNELSTVLLVLTACAIFGVVVGCVITKQKEQ